MPRVRIRRFLAAICLLAAGLAAPAAQVAGEQPQHVFRSSVDLVTIQASVRDHGGRPVTGLTTADFEVRDNGELRPILSLRSDLQSAISVAVLVDMSGSMRIGPKIAMARQAFEAVISQLREGEDEGALFTFDSSLHERQRFTGDLATLRQALSQFEPFGSTSLYDATAETARQLATRSGAHKAIIVLTDGIDTSSTLTAAEVSALASSIDVPVYVVATVSPGDQRPSAVQRAADAAADLRDLADWTGGRFVFATTLTESVLVATNIVDELRRQYVLAIEAAAGPEWRRLDIRVKKPSTSVKARSGYFGG